MYLTQCLHRSLQCTPDAPATIFGERMRTFREQADRVARLAGALRALGVRDGERVGILALNSDRYAELLLAVPWANGVLNPVNVRWAPREIVHALSESQTEDMIISGGENVYSTEVENAIARHPAVAACAVIGVPDGTWGERVHAVIVLRPGHAVDAAAIRDHCRSSIAAYKLPRSCDFVDALPMSPAGKVLKHELRRPYWAGAERQVG